MFRSDHVSAALIFFMPATGMSDMDREIFRKNADPLYAFNASAKGAKAQRNKLRLEHGQSLASFTMQTLGSLPSSLSSAGAADAAAEQPLSLLRCAREAAFLVASGHVDTHLH